MDDQNTPIEPATEAPTQAQESVPTPIEPESASQMALRLTICPRSPRIGLTNAYIITPVEDQNPPINQPENNASEEPISAPSEPEIRLMINQFL